MFGGRGYAETRNEAYLADLWRYNPEINMWTWVSGPKTENSAGSPGIKGTPSSSNYPSARMQHSMWIDENDDIWIFGGRTTAVVILNDLWKFSGGRWTWVSGSTSSTSVRNPRFG